MKKLLVQDYLEIKSFKNLENEHGVYASFSKCGCFWSMNYDQIEAKESELLSQQCRGLILSKMDGRSLLDQSKIINGKIVYNHICPGETRILCYGMNRFFNYGQGSAAQINWNDDNLVVLEKLDGTLCQIWYNPFLNKWNVSTRGCPEADLLMDNGIFTFRTLFEKALLETSGKTFDEYTKLLSKTSTYCFELTTPYNRIVVNYPNNGVTLLAVRLISGDLPEFDLQEMQSIRQNEGVKMSDFWGVPIVKSYTYTTISDLIDWVSTLNPTEHEGLVVKQGEKRIKVKNAAYEAASKMRDSLATSPRNCLKLILLGKDDDAISFLPQEIASNLLSLKEKFILWLKKQDSLSQMIFEEANSIAPDKKTFALTVQKHKPAMPAALFAMYDGKANSIKSFIDNNRKEGTWSDSFIDKILSVI